MEFRGGDWPVLFECKMLQSDHRANPAASRMILILNVTLLYQDAFYNRFASWIELSVGINGIA